VNLARNPAPRRWQNRSARSTARVGTTRYSLAIAGLIQLDGRITPKGLHTPAEAVPFDGYVAELAKPEIAIGES
jgi:hypothetical protein